MVEFDSTNDIINCGSNGTLNNLPFKTISAWIYPRTMGESGLGGIATKNNGTTAWAWRAKGGDSIELFGGCTGSDYTLRADSDSLVRNTWQHVLLTMDTSSIASNQHIYVNGVETGYAAVGGGSGVLNDDDAIAFCIGNRAALDRTFDGFISDVAVWDVELSLSEIKMLSQAKVKYFPLQVRPGNLKAYFPMDDRPDGQAPTDTGAVRDRVGANHGTPSNGPIFRAENALSYM